MDPLGTFDSCLFEIAAIGISAGLGGSVRNCTFIMKAAAAGTTSRAYSAYGSIYNSHEVYNCVAYGDNSLGFDPLDGIYIAGADASNIIDSCIVFGTFSRYDYRITGPSVDTNNLDQADVTASGENVFANYASENYHPFAAGLAYHSGDASNAPAEDFNSKSFYDPPSRGYLEALINCWCGL